MEKVANTTDLDPRVEHLWKSFKDFCTKVNAGRADEDRVGFENRKLELEFLHSLHTREGDAAYQRAKFEDDRLFKLSDARQKYDGQLVRELFESAMKLNLKLELDPTAQPPGWTVAAQPASASGTGHGLGFDSLGEVGSGTLTLSTRNPTFPTSMNESPAGDQALMDLLNGTISMDNLNFDMLSGLDTAPYNDGTGLPYGGGTASGRAVQFGTGYANNDRAVDYDGMTLSAYPMPAGPSSMSVYHPYGSVPSGSMARAPLPQPPTVPNPSNTPGELQAGATPTPRQRKSKSVAETWTALDFPRTILLKDVPANISLAQHPRRIGAFKEEDYSVPWYILQCPICDRTFQSAHGAYGHFSQNDARHLDLFSNGKSFDAAVLIAGTMVIDVTNKGAKAHNDIADEIMVMEAQALGSS